MDTITARNPSSATSSRSARTCLRVRANTSVMARSGPTRSSTARHNGRSAGSVVETMPTSIASMPTSASRPEITVASSGVNATPAMCALSRSVASDTLGNPAGACIVSVLE